MSKFSVLMPVYWREDPAAFSAALDSVFTNTRVPNEVVLVCDGPLSSALERIIEEHAQRPEFRVVRLSENMGIVAALNRGLAEVRHEVVVRCDSDDVNHHDRFEKLVEKLDEGYSVVGSQIVEVNDVGEVTARKELPTAHDDIVRYARRRNPINHMTVAFRTSDVLDLGSYPNVFLKEDYALWALLIGTGKRFANLPVPLVTARAGIQMYARRGGYKAAASEIDLQRILVKAGISSPIEALLFGLVRYAALFSPTAVRAFVYKNFLRRRA